MIMPKLELPHEQSMLWTIPDYHWQLHDEAIASTGTEFLSREKKDYNSNRARSQRIRLSINNNTGKNTG